MISTGNTVWWVMGEQIVRVICEAVLWYRTIVVVLSVSRISAHRAISILPSICLHMSMDAVL